jgi:hypothetical protein
VPAAGAAAALFFSTEGSTEPLAAFLAVVAVIVAVVFWLWRGQLPLVARLLRVAAAALGDAPSIAATAGGILLLG